MTPPGIMIGGAFTASLAALLVSGAAHAADPVKIAAGERIALRACGECHAIGLGPSPLADSPPFRGLHRRYPPGGLAQLLEEGMLPPDKPQEEGSAPRHPRMPVARLEVDEVASLTAYLKSLEP